MTRCPTAPAGASGDRVEEAETDAERDAREPEHATELAPAEHRDRHHVVCLAHRQLGTTTPVATVASVIVLAAVLGVVAWGRVPDALAAVPAAVLVVVVGLVSFDDALDVLDRLLPTLVFLASIFVIAEAVRAAGLFERAGTFLSRGPHTSVRRLLVAISLAAVAVTTVMSLDATAVLFTPVVIGLVRSRHIDSERPLLVTTQLANAGSGLLPVSNLTNLLVFSATGLTFGGFAVRMLLPTAAASAVVVVGRLPASSRRADDGARRVAVPAEPSTASLGS